MKKSGLPVWFPSLNSWLSALTLLMLINGFTVIIRSNNNLLLYLTRLSNKPELLTVLLILLLLSPIPAIALVYHFLLSRFIAIIPGEKINKSPGLVPELISWWESLYSWLVFLLSTLIAMLLCTPLLPLFKLNYKTIIYTSNLPHTNIEAIFISVWLFSAAILYQIEYLVKLRLVFGNSIQNRPESMHDASIDANTNSQQGNIDLTQIPTNDKPTTKKTTISDWLAKQKNLPRKIFIIILTPLVALWLYQFAKLQEVRQTISTNLPLENPSSATLESSVTKSKPSDLPQRNSIATPSRSPDLPQRNSIATPSWSPDLPQRNSIATSSRSPDLPPKIATPSQSPDLQPKDDPFAQAVKKGKRAVRLTKIAQTQDEWKIVEGKWKEAIELLEAVPTSSPNYALARKKIIQYQIRLNYARHNAVGGKMGG